MFFIFIPNLGEMIQFDVRIFFRWGWFNQKIWMSSWFKLVVKKARGSSLIKNPTLCLIGDFWPSVACAAVSPCHWLECLLALVGWVSGSKLNGGSERLKGWLKTMPGLWRTSQLQTPQWFIRISGKVDFEDGNPRLGASANQLMMIPLMS